MSYEVIMPQMGESITEGTITTWIKKIGDTVKRDEPLFEISTDKVDAEIPSPENGILSEIKAQEGEVVAVDSVVAIIQAEGEKKIAPSIPQDIKTEKDEIETHIISDVSVEKSDKKTVSVEERRRTKSSPLVRNIANKHSIDITQLSGTGISGRVTKNDILTYIEKSQNTSIQKQIPSLHEIPQAHRAKIFEGDRVEDMTKMRSLIAEHMIISKQVSPHVQTVYEIDFTHIEKLRKKYKPIWKERYGINLTYTHFTIKVVIDSLKAFPMINASVDQQKIIYHRDINLGLAVALDNGLIVPVISKAQDFNLLGLAKRANDLGVRAKTKKLKPEEVQDGTFTITNPGVFGNIFGLPIINQPQVAILGMGGIEKRPVVIDDMIAIRTRAYFSMSYDHRLVDGADADKFLTRVKTGLQEFDEAEL